MKLARTRAYYDLADQDTLSRSVAGTAGGDSTVVAVRQQFDAEGNVLTHTTTIAPDTNHLGSLVHTWTYDLANRKLSEQPQGPAHGTERWTYDPAGNVTSWLPRGGGTITTTYDVLNRPAGRVVPSVSAMVVWPTTYTFGDVIPADTQTFAYDVAGNLTQANNLYARITRRWNANGTLASDSTRLRDSDSASAAFTLAYGVRYGYDLEGRRTWLKLPGTLAAVGTDSLATGYDALTGALASVRDGIGEQFSYTYDNAQRLSTVTHLVGTANVAVETRTYDDESRVIRRAMTRGATVLVADTLHHDTRSKLLAATGLVPNTGAVHQGFVYAAAGPLVADNFGGAASHTYVTDVLGNARTTVSTRGGSKTSTSYYRAGHHDPGSRGDGARPPRRHGHV